MKKIIFLFSIVFLLVSLIGCSDDDGGSSSSTGLDFSDDDIFEDLNSYFMVSGTDVDFRLMIASKENVTSSTLNINGSDIDINNYWIDLSAYDDDFAFAAIFDDSMLPENLVIEPGTELDINFMLNGTSLNQTMTVPSAPNVQNQTLDLEQDFTVTWTLDQNPQVQVVSLEGESYFWDEEDDGFDADVEVAGSVRSHKFSKNNYSEYAVPGLSWYQYGVETINYNLTGKNIMFFASDTYIEEYSFKANDTESKVKKVSNLVKSLVK